ncbi:MAG: amidophosphoribosyltransferase, partial [Alphaproteobacteria bacterium]|nr:amidophosphoribosyltransferase [Alphaproteobacteria bacterium]
MQIIKHHALKWPGLLLDLVLPPRCPMTGALVGRQGALDPEYWAKLNFIRKPFCVTCGNPFANAITGEMTCGACMEAPPIYGRGRAVLRYDDASAGMILKYKHADGTQLAHIMAHFMMQGGSEVLRKADLLIPVPLHRW